jgi:hypothetical protein
VAKLSLEDWLYDLLDRALYNAIFDGRNPKRSASPWFSALWDELSSARTRLVVVFTQLLPNLCQEDSFSVLALDFPNRHPIDTRRSPTSIGGNATPGRS